MQNQMFINVLSFYMLYAIKSRDDVLVHIVSAETA